jgi:putative nucleotidyltransferase with HDIG domain
VPAAVTAALPLAVLHFFGRETVHFGGEAHFAVVVLAAAIATGAAVALTWVGARRSDGRAVLVGGAFSVMAALLLLHGLTTPGILVETNGVVAFTGGATLPVGGALLALTALPALRRAGAVPWLLGLVAALLVAVLGLGLLAIVEPSFVPSVPAPGGPVALGLLVAGLLFYGVLATRAGRTTMLTRRVGDTAVTVGIVWLAAALAAALLLDYWALGWWLGHVFEVIGILLVTVPVAVDLMRGTESRPLVGDLRGADLVRREEVFLGSQVRALLVSLAHKDASTEEHTRRVALRAVQVGEELGFGAARLRTLAIGGLLHDIGKLSTPDTILRKAGPLTESEFAVIMEHPEHGRRLLRELGGFADAVLGLVAHHHERLDGSGYPHRLAGDELSLDVRILGVCDVYDALVSKRVYRNAWSHERALALVREGVGTQFDVRCVDALERVLAAERASRRGEEPAVGALAVAV